MLAASDLARRDLQSLEKKKKKKKKKKILRRQASEC
jgi:hypothetical protein